MIAIFNYIIPLFLLELLPITPTFISSHYMPVIKIKNVSSAPPII